jgi:hypothetical protein
MHLEVNKTGILIKHQLVVNQIMQVLVSKCKDQTSISGRVRRRLNQAQVQAVIVTQMEMMKEIKWQGLVNNLQDQI